MTARNLGTNLLLRISSIQHHFWDTLYGGHNESLVRVHQYLSSYDVLDKELASLKRVELASKLCFLNSKDNSSLG